MHRITYFLLWAIVFVMPFENAAAFVGFETLSRIIGYAAGAFALLAILTRLTIRPLPRTFILFALLLAWVCLSLLWSVGSELTQKASITCLYLMVFTWMIWEFAPSVDRQLWLMRAFIFGCAVPMLMQYTTYRLAAAAPTEILYDTRFTGGGRNLNELAHTLVFAMLFAGYLASTKLQTVRMRIAYWAFIPVTGVSVLLTGSRSGAISLAVAVLVLLFFVAKVGWRARIAALLAVAALAVILPQVVPEALVRRVTEGTESAGFRARVELWQQGLDAVQKVPFTGIGAAASSDDNAFGIVLHNSFISVLVETGVIGFVLFMGILAAVIRAAWLMPARERAFWLGVLAVWGPFALAGTNEYVKNTWFVFAMILAQSAALRGTQPHGAGLLNGVSSTAKYVLLTPRHTA